MSLSQEQSDALIKVDRWFKNKNREKDYFYLAGLAGTGKTHTAKYFAEQVDGLVLYAAFAGKAALQMQKAGCHGASTIHSLIYKPIVDKDGNVKFTLNGESVLGEAALLIVDECSMVNEEIGSHIMSFGVPVLALGDPAQLPPVEGAGYFTSGKPDAMLTQIHRQAKGNPIIELAHMVRNKDLPEMGSYGDCRIVSKLKSTDLLEHDQVLVGRNLTRTKLNDKIRGMLNYEGDEPQKTERLICLKNDKDKGIFNGGMFTVDEVIQRYKFKTSFISMKVASSDFPLKTTVKVHRSFFDGSSAPNWKTLVGSQEFDYGYAITVHKSQGSQWDTNLIYDESWCFRDDKWRWLYTSITRSAERFTWYRS